MKDVRAIAHLYMWSEFAVMAWVICVVVGVLVLVTGPLKVALEIFFLAAVCPPAGLGACRVFLRVEKAVARALFS